MNATGMTAPANSKNAMKTDTSMVTRHAGLNTAGTTADVMNVKSGTLLAVMSSVNGCGSPMSAHKVVLRSVSPKQLPMTSRLLLRHGAPTDHAMMTTKSKKLKMMKIGSMTSGILTKTVSRTKVNYEKAKEAIIE